MTYKIAVNINVLGALMKDIIMSDLNSIEVVTIKRSIGVLRYTHILEKPTNLKKLRNSVNKSAIFSFGTRASNNILFLAPPKNKKAMQ